MESVEGWALAMQVQALGCWLLRVEKQSSREQQSRAEAASAAEPDSATLLAAYGVTGIAFAIS